MAHKGRMSSLKLPPNNILGAEIELGRKWFSCPAKVFEISFFPLCIRMYTRSTKDETGRKIVNLRSTKTSEIFHIYVAGSAFSWDKENHGGGYCTGPILGPKSVQLCVKHRHQTCKIGYQTVNYFDADILFVHLY